ncbi:Cathepsin_L [Hexamita inflata]|uniref:Cathepsin L n=1 Tax=Hexamita inflata TaxID=28002 RepID=A0AA86NUJ8_9EUKA|nr:Cathepsin L [Hexamita inflata]
MISLLLISLQNDIINLSCDEAFHIFQKQFNKSYIPQNYQEHHDIFCANLEQLQKLLKQSPSPYISLVPMMDTIPAPSLTPLPKRLSAPTNDLCQATSPLPDLTSIHASMDLREPNLIMPPKNQGMCSSSYAFQTISILENAILRDLPNLNAFWQAKATNLNLSEQFLMSNAICNDGCWYCSGGSFVSMLTVSVTNNILQQPVSGKPTMYPITTVELQENFPYDYSNRQAAWTAGTVVNPVISASNYLLPFQQFPNSGTYATYCDNLNKKTPIVRIYDDNAAPFPQATIRTIQSYIARGIAISVQFLIGSGTAANDFYFYKNGGKVLHADCTAYGFDQTVTLVGYGKKNGKNVWVIKNVWGPSWGDNGYFFVEQGKDSFCIEHYAYTVIPKYFNLAESTPYSRGTLNRGKTFTLDCDNFYTNITGQIDCYDSCPSGYPYSVVGTTLCINKCPDGTIQAGNSCVNTCPSAQPFQDTTGCVARCASGSYQATSQGLVCITACTGIYITNTSNSNSKQCITKCPDAIPYYEPGICLAKCSSNYYNVVTGDQTLICTTTCSLFVVNTSAQNSRQCVTTCPSSAPYSDYTPQTGTCSVTCSSGAYTVVTGAQTLICQPSCTYYVMNVTVNLKQCVGSCPSGAPYSDGGLCSAQCSKFAYSNMGGQFICQDSCPNYYITNTTSNSKLCVDKCTGDMFASGKECISSCPAGTPYKDTTGCTAQCKSLQYQVIGTDSICVDQCVYYISGANSQKQCFTQCPSDKPYSNSGLCSTTCTSGYYVNSQGFLLCQATPCQMYVLNTTSSLNQCFAQCPSGYPYLDTAGCTVKCNSGYYLVITGQTQQLICTTECSFYVFNVSNGNSKQCISQCPSATPYYEVGYCVSKCTYSMYYVGTGTQTLICQSSSCNYFVMNTTSNQKQCLSRCPDATPYADSGLCSVRCTSGAYQNIGGYLICQPSCLKYFITNTSNQNSKQCVADCLSNQVLSGTECLSSCPSTSPYQESLTCVSRCSTGAYQIISGSYICIASCQGMYITNTSNSNSKQCITQCPVATPYYETGACVSRCTSGIYTVMTGSAQTLFCIQSCGTFVLNASNQNSKQCVDTCPSDIPYSESGQCVNRCSTGAYYYASAYAQPLICQSSCTYYVVNITSNSKQCLVKCPDATPYADNGLCVARCSTGKYFVVTSQAQTLICQASCTFYIINSSNGDSQQCLASCPDSLPYSDAGQCKARCSSGAYMFVTGQGLFCVDKCTYYVINASNGDSMQCLAQCPSGTPYSDSGLCVSRCSSGNYQIINSAYICQATCTYYVVNITNGNSHQCLTQCPSAYPFAESGLCVAHCSTNAYNPQFICQSSCNNLFLTNTSDQNSQLCLDACPTGYIQNVKECITKCPSATPYYDKNKCVDRCASGQYSIFPAYAQSYICQDNCYLFNYNTSNGNSKLCYDYCPPALPFANKGECVQHCSPAFYILSNKVLICTDFCPNLFIKNTTDFDSHFCVDSCPTPLFTQNKECVSTCANYSTGTTCVNTCPDKIQQKVCVQNCTSQFNFINGQFCQNECPIYQDGPNNTFTCVDSCPLFVSNGTLKHCVDSCTWNQKDVQGECVKDGGPVAAAAIIPIILLLLIGLAVAYYMYRKKHPRPVKPVELKPVKDTSSNDTSNKGDEMSLDVQAMAQEKKQPPKLSLQTDLTNVNSKKLKPMNLPTKKVAALGQLNGEYTKIKPRPMI